ncbi:MAG TPA: hypothetical protein VM576_01360 [Xanthomonadaceae bacterium]|jgi:hypothetical protein|nr:hypothetical protein [Xanthomonadaceae bacterium]
MPRLSPPRLLACACGLVPALAAGAALAQDPAPPGDPTLVVTRTVHPRVAYRGLPASDNPVAAQATLFPAQAFAGTIGATLVDDDALAQRGSAGLAQGAALAPLTSGTALQPVLSTTADLRVPLAGAHGRVVGLGQFLTRSLLLGTGMPRQRP